MKSFEFAAAGHPGSMESDNGCIFYKPFNAMEHAFYLQIEEARSRESPTSNDFTIDQFTTPFYGKLDAGLGEGVNIEALDGDMLRRVDQTMEIGGENYLVLKNIIFGYSMPIVLDVKLGRVLFDGDSSLEKQRRMEKVSKSTTSGSLGFRICGLKIELGPEGDYEEYIQQGIEGVEYEKCVCVEGGHILSFNKVFGRSLNDENVHRGLEMAFRSNKLSKEIQDGLIKMFFLRLEILYNCLLDEEVRCVSSSLLFVMEGDPKRWIDREDEVFYENRVLEDDDDEEEEEEAQAPLSELKWIDFAHSRFTTGEGYDEELVLGVENIINELNKLIN